MPRKKKISSVFYDIVDPMAEGLDSVSEQTKRVVETGISLQDHFRYVAIGLRGFTRRTSMKMLSSVLSFATPIDIENIVEDVTSSAITVHRFVRNSGVLPLFAARFRYFKYEEQDLSEFLDDLERARDIVADMEFDRIDMAYSIDVVRGAEALIAAMSGLKSKGLSGVKTLAETGVKLKGIKGKLPLGAKKESEAPEESEEVQLEEAISSEDITERLSSIRREWPEFKEAVDDLCVSLKPLLTELNRALGMHT
jgi:hypothetical protein